MTYRQLASAVQVEGPISIVVDLARIAMARARSAAVMSDQEAVVHWRSVSERLHDCARDLSAA